jgi:hypothetical protein
LILSTAILLGACAATPQEAERTAMAQADTAAALDRELAGLVPGEPSACLPEPLRVQVASRTYGPTIVYAVSRDVKYRTDTSGGCERAGRGRDVLVTQTTLNRSCRGDIARTVDPVTGFQTGACSFGDFVPYRRP